MLQPGPSGAEEEQGEVADDEVVIVCSTQLAGQPVVREPQFRSCLPRVLCDGSRGSEPGRERRPSYGSAESLRAGRVRARGSNPPRYRSVPHAWGGSLGAPSRRGGLDGCGGGARCRGVPGVQASSRRFLSSPRIRRPSVVDGSGIARRSIATAARFWPTPLEAGGGLALTLSAMRSWTPWDR
jgi:hypothetical protein